MVQNIVMLAKTKAQATKPTKKKSEVKQEEKIQTRAAAMPTRK